MPEPNLLYTPLGKLDKDILFWSTMGSSYSYNLFMGLLEVIPAFMLLFRRTRTLGLIISFGVLVNVLAINLSFDISVKLFVCFLLSVILFLLIPTLKPIWQVLMQKEAFTVHPQNLPSYLDTYFFWKIILMILITCEAISPYTRSGNFQDDLARRPPLHGAYEVLSFGNGQETSISTGPTFKRLFIHRDGFLVFQDQQDEMIDLKMNLDPENRRLELTDYEGHTTYGTYHESANDSMLLIKIDQNGQSLSIHTKQLDWRKLPLLQSHFHWTVD
jgi:hypothetical protein